MAARALGDERMVEVARKHLDFTLTLQLPNGWFQSNSLRPLRSDTPLTHTIGYAAAGFLEAGLALNEPRYVDAARRTADSVAAQMGEDGFLAGEFDADWKPRAVWSCLTGTAQMAIIWWRLFELNGDEIYATTARRAIAYLMSRHEVTGGGPGIRGGIAGSFPVSGRYGKFQHLNWAAKFFVDALLMAERVGGSEFRLGTALTPGTATVNAAAVASLHGR